MKILHVVPNYPPEFRGGVERHVETLARELRELGVESIVASGSEQRLAAACARSSLHEGVAVVRFHRRAGDDYSVALLHPELEPLLDETLSRTRPSLVHVHHWFNHGLGVVARSARLGIPAVVTLHDVWTSCPRFFRVVGGRFCELAHAPGNCAPCVAPDAGLPVDVLRTQVVAREAGIARELATAAVVVAPSRALRDFLAPQLAHARRVEVVPHGVAERPAPPPSPPAAGPPWSIGGWGSVVPEKGIHLLVAAAQELSSGRAIEVHWWGHLPDDGYVRRLRELDRHGLLRLHGPFAPGDLPAIAARLHLALFPSICFESFGLAVEEALALGLPVVVSARGAPPERIGSAGVAVPADDVAALRGAVERLLADPRRLHELADAPRPTRTMADVARELAALYREAAASA